MPEVIVHGDEPIERALRRFRKTCERVDLLSELRRFRHYEKPGERRKRKMIAARRAARGASRAGSARG